MLNSKLIDYVSERLKIDRRDLIEKDILLSKILYSLSLDSFFTNNYAFKGGTCITKCYLGYFRFSEDLDFTYMNFSDFDSNSGKSNRKIINDKLDHLGNLIKNISIQLGFRFVYDKNDQNYVQFGAGNIYTTFKIWYYSTELKKDSFIKIQFNFIEKLKYPIKKAKPLFILHGRENKDFSFMFEEAEILIKEYFINVYDIKEILLEKTRAILTRKGMKFRDFLDVYKIIENEKIDIKSLKDEIVERILFSFKYNKYKSNFNEKEDISFSKEMDETTKNKEENIMIGQLPNDFDKFLINLKKDLIEIIKEIEKQEIKGEI